MNEAAPVATAESVNAGRLFMLAPAVDEDDTVKAGRLRTVAAAVLTTVVNVKSADRMIDADPVAAALKTLPMLFIATVAVPVLVASSVAVATKVAFGNQRGFLGGRL